MNSKLAIVLLSILSSGQKLRAANINQQSQSIVGGNSNSFNRNVGKSVVQNINNFGSFLFPDEPQPQPQEQQQPVPDSQPQPNDPQQQQQSNSQQQRASNSPQLEPLPDRQQVTSGLQPQQILVNSQPIQISSIPSLRQIPI